MLGLLFLILCLNLAMGVFTMATVSDLTAAIASVQAAANAVLAKLNSAPAGIDPAELDGPVASLGNIAAALNGAVNPEPVVPPVE